MIGLLLFISFLLHAAAFYWIFQLKRRLSENSEIEGVLAVYTEEMKEENEKLIRRLQELESQNKMEEIETSGEPLVDPAPINHKISNSNDDEVKNSYIPPADSDHGKEQFKPSVEAQALSLSKQGLGHEEIAKKLGRGKGEIELLLRLSGKKQQIEKL